ncbi:hypothetical protein ACFY40_32915 [Streptomyces sp. NPDC012950]|uniref:hypothetical protein n=1 Tax=Streptomyces sp. NPDC012950 TaxID=3364858 RepID=UPI0036B03227
MRPKQLSELERGPSGTTPSSPTATADRAVCDGFADLLSFSPPHGGSLVVCTYVREYEVSGTGKTGTVRFGKGSDTDVLLGGGGRERRSVKETGSMTALIEVPTSKSAPATVLGCDCYAPRTLTATGVPAP